MNISAPKPVLLCILDGWGYREETTHNAIALANTPNWDNFTRNFPFAKLATSGLAVGLPEGQMGNSEVGHMTIGGGRVFMQSLPRIDTAIANGSLAKNPELVKLIDALKASGGTCHLMGLLSDGGVHSHSQHIIALARMLADAHIPVKIHAFLDGRDTPPESAKGYTQQLLESIAALKNVDLATMCGRYYAMDRDKRWDRVKLAYDAMMQGKGTQTDDAIAAIDASYADKKPDEFVLPVVLHGYAGMKDGDALLCANFRADRAREIITSFVDPAFNGFATKPVQFVARLGMVNYSDALDKFLTTLFPAELPIATLGEVLAKAGKKQLRIAETEKYAHVTFFFNGGQEAVFDGEDRILIPSPDVPTYDHKPEMSAPEVTDKLVEAITSGKYDFIAVNYANGDMVGHTGIESAAIKAAEAVDNALGRLWAAIQSQGGIMLVTADHGNAELMVDPETGAPHTAHTTGPVPLLVMGAPESTRVQDGGLADLAPTLLKFLQLPQPEAMTGQVLVA